MNRDVNAEVSIFKQKAATKSAAKIQQIKNIFLSRKEKLKQLKDKLCRQYATLYSIILYIFNQVIGILFS